MQNRFGSAFFTQLFFSFFGLQAKRIRKIDFQMKEPTTRSGHKHSLLESESPGISPSRESQCSPIMFTHLLRLGHPNRCPQACTLWYIDRDRMDRERACRLYNARRLMDPHLPTGGPTVVCVPWGGTLHPCTVVFQEARLLFWHLRARSTQTLCSLRFFLPWLLEETVPPAC